MAILIVACASIAFAQSTDYNKVEFYGGYSHNRVDTGSDDPALRNTIGEREGFHGFNTSLTGNITRYVGLKGDFAGHFKKKTIPLGGNAQVDIDSSVFNLLGGVQLKDNSKETTFKPFAHALVGFARGRNQVDFVNVICPAVQPSQCGVDATYTDTGIAGAFGGGLDIRLNDRIDLRAIQLDYNPTRLFDTSQHNLRIGVGIVIH